MSRSNDCSSTYDVCVMSAAVPGDRSVNTFPQRNVCKEPLQRYLGGLSWRHGTHRRLSRSPRASRRSATPSGCGCWACCEPRAPATATTLAARLELNTGATSYHLRQLAEGTASSSRTTERGNASRPVVAGRAPDHARRLHHAARTPEDQDTYDAYLQAVAISYRRPLQQSLTERRNLPPAWHDAWDISDWHLRLTAARAKALVEAVHALIEEYGEDAEDDEDAETFRINVNAFLRPGTVVAEDES